MESTISKAQLELEWLAAAMVGNKQWASNRSTHRVYVHEGSEIVVWSSNDGHTPSPKAIYRVVGLEMTATRGITIGLKSPECALQVVTGKPHTLLGTDVFLWVPAFSDVRFTPRPFGDPESIRRLSVPICLKAPTNPLSIIKPDTMYVTERREFIKQWPGVSL